MFYLDVILFKVAEELRESVYNETGLTCSAGVAPNRLLAKVLQAMHWKMHDIMYSPCIINRWCKSISLFSFLSSDNYFSE